MAQCTNDYEAPSVVVCASRVAIESYLTDWMSGHIKSSFLHCNLGEAVDAAESTSLCALQIPFEEIVSAEDMSIVVLVQLGFGSYDFTLSFIDYLKYLTAVPESAFSALEVE